MTIANEHRAPYTVERTSVEVRDAPYPVGMFAVFRHHNDRKSARFVCVHAQEAAALAEAQRLTSMKIAQHGQTEECFFVTQITNRVGIINGKLETGER